MVNEKSEFFQIWLDPNLNETLGHEPSYDDYESSRFPVIKENNREEKVYMGEGSPMTMYSKGVEIKEITFEAGEHRLDLDSQQIYSGYVLEGSVSIGDNNFETKDYFIADDQHEIVLKSDSPFKLFLISTPGQLSYHTYSQLVRRQMA